MKTDPAYVYLIHGEPQALDLMRVKLKDTFGWNTQIPELYELKKSL